jgi:undecaprenyl-diphosphatase
MPLYQVVVLALVQGVTEFLPISSTAHLALFPWLFGWKDPGLTFDVALHAGTLVAVIVYFWRSWLNMTRAGLGIGKSGNPHSAENRRLFWFLVLATVPAGFAGWVFEDAAENQLRQPELIATAMIVVGLLIWAGDKAKAAKATLGQINLVDSVLVGIAQALAIIPGVSRSGATMTAALFRGLNRETSARFSFLLSTPIIAGAVLKKGVEIVKHGLPPDMLMPFLVGTVVAAASGYLVIAWLIRYLERRTFKIFIVYRLAFGVLVLALGWGLRHHAG